MAHDTQTETWDKRREGVDAVKRKPKRRAAEEKSKEPLSPTAKKKLEVLKKQKQDQKIKQYLTADFAYTGIPGAKATAKGVRYRVNKAKKRKRDASVHKGEE